MIGKNTEERYQEIAPGIRIKTLVHGESTLMSRFLLARGSLLPSHSHPYEQTGYLVQGRLRLTVGADTFEIGRHDSWCIPSGVEHRAEVLEDSIAVEVFTPARHDYMAYFSEKDARGI